MLLLCKVSLLKHFGSLINIFGNFGASCDFAHSYELFAMLDNAHIGMIDINKKHIPQGRTNIH